jgi:hypothetical protein
VADTFIDPAAHAEKHKKSLRKLRLPALTQIKIGLPSPLLTQIKARPGAARQHFSMCRWLFMFGLAMFIGAMGAAASAQQQPARRGGAQEEHRLALSKCDVCHIVASDLGSAISFASVALRAKLLRCSQ